jgi:NRPS condensation-like uncharacterized protein
MSTTRQMGSIEKIATMIAQETGGSNHIGSVLKVRGTLAVDEFKRGWEILFRRHPMLRATQRYEEGEYFFDFNARFEDIPLRYLETEDMNLIEQEYKVEIFKLLDFKRYYWRATLIVSSKNTFYLIFGIAHAISDGRSRLHLLGEFLRVISELRTGKAREVISQPVPFAIDDIFDHSRFLPSSDIPAREELYFEKPTTPALVRTENFFYEITEDKFQKIKEAGKKCGVGFNSFLVAILVSAIAGCKLNKEDEVNPFFTIDLRPYTTESVSSQTLAYYACMPFCRTNPKKSASFWELAAQVEKCCMKELRALQLPKVREKESFGSFVQMLRQHISEGRFFAPYGVSSVGKVDAFFEGISEHFKIEFPYSIISNYCILGFFIVSVILNNKAYLTFNFCEPALTKETGKALIHWIINFLETSCYDC